jgi:hypothetical protein
VRIAPDSIVGTASGATRSRDYPMWPLNGIEMCQNELLRSQSKGPPMDKIIRIGMETSKHVFQLHGVNAGEKPVLRKKMRRKEMADFSRPARQH